MQYFGEKYNKICNSCSNCSGEKKEITEIDCTSIYNMPLEEKLHQDNPESNELFEQLRSLRAEIAREIRMPPYIIFSDKSLHDMCEKMPQNDREFLNVEGVGNSKLQKYGQQFMNIIRGYLQEHGKDKSFHNISKLNSEVDDRINVKNAVEDANSPKKPEKTCAGSKWNGEEDQKLIREFHDGMDIQSMAIAHERT